jgi:parallel beta-helix repeat protein
MKFSKYTIAKMAGSIVLTMSTVASAGATTSGVFVDDNGCSANGPGTRNQPYCTIQQGVDHVESGGTVHVAPGSYNQPVTVSKPVIILGAAFGRGSGMPTDTALRSVVTDAAVTINSDEVTVEGITFTGNTTGPGLATAGNHSGYHIVNNVFSDNVFGLYFNSNGAKPSYAKRNVFTANNREGAANGSGIYSDQNLRDATISGNTFSDQSNFSILIAATETTINNNIDVRDNTINHGGGGVLFVRVNNSLISHNTIRNLDGNGIMLVRDGANNSVRDNTVLSSYRGIRIGHGEYGTGVQTKLLISHNTFNDSADDGILITEFAMKEGTIRDNIITRSGADGIELREVYSGNIIRNNTISSSTVYDAYDFIGVFGPESNIWTNNKCQTSLPSSLCAK